jgi:hypothetical protein
MGGDATGRGHRGGDPRRARRGGGASAAVFTALPPQITQSGAGPFTWAFTSSIGDAVAYKLSTEYAWHRCEPDGAVTLSGLADGRYSVAIRRRRRGLRPPVHGARRSRHGADRARARGRPRSAGDRRARRAGGRADQQRGRDGAGRGRGLGRAGRRPDPGRRTLRIAGRPYALQKAGARLAFVGGTVDLHLTASARVRRAMRAALRRHVAVRAELRVTAKDVLGNTRVVRRTVRLRG